jgi:hypothetical protein
VTAKQAAKIAADIEADLECALEYMRQAGAIEAAQQHFAAYSEEVCHRKPENLTDFEWHGVKLAYRFGIPTEDFIDFAEEFSGSVAEIKKATEWLDDFTYRILSRRGLALRVQLSAQLVRIALEREKSEQAAGRAGSWVFWW